MLKKILAVSLLMFQALTITSPLFFAIEIPATERIAVTVELQYKVTAYRTMLNEQHYEQQCLEPPKPILLSIEPEPELSPCAIELPEIELDPIMPEVIEYHEITEPEIPLINDFDDEHEMVYVEINEHELEVLSKMVYGESRGLSDIEIELTCWTVYNRIDSGLYPTNIISVIIQPNQFMGYKPTHPVDPRLYEIVFKTYMDWVNGEPMPTHEIYAPEPNYLFFNERKGDDGRYHNYFRPKYEGS